MAILDGDTGSKYSSGEWSAECQQHTIEELQVFGAEVAEGIWRDVSAIRGFGSDIAWWNGCSQAGAGLAMKVLWALAEGMGGLENVTSGFGKRADGVDVQGLVVIEDFMLRPNDKGLGGRNVLSPVAITAAFLVLWQQLSSVQVLISGTGNKSLMDDAKIKRWFPTGGGVKGTSWVGAGKRHGTDALRHALWGVRMVK